ncbi:hypothetical protein MTO96_019777 [Rhipicephalus appendiculatus]
MPLVQPTLLRDDAPSLPQDNLSEAPPVRHATSAHCLKKHRPQALTFCGHGGPSTSMWIYRPFLCFMQVCVGLAASTVKPHQAVNTGLRRPYLVNYEVWPLIASASSMPLVQPTLLRDDAPSLPQDNLSEAPPVRHATSAHCLKKHRPQALTFCGHGGPSTSMWIYRPFLCFMQVCVGLAASTVKPHQAVNTGLRRPYLVNYEVWPLIASASSMPLVQPTLLRDDAPSLPQDNLSEAPPVRHATSAHCLKKHRSQALTFCGHGGPSTSMWIYRPFLCFMQVCVGLAASTVKPHQAVNTGLRRPYLVNYEVWPLIASASSMPLVQPTLLRDDAPSLPQDNLSEAPPVRHATSAHCLKKHRSQALTFCGHGGPSTSMWIYRPFLCFMQVCVGLAASTVKPHQAVNTGLRRPYLVNYEVWPLIASASSMPLVQPTLLRDDAASLPQDNLSEAPPVRHATSAHCLKKHRPQALTFCGHGGPSTSMWIYRPFLCFMQVCVGLAASTVKPHQAVNTGLRRPYLVNYEVWPLIASASSMPLVQPTLLRDDAPSLPQDNLSEAPPVRHATSAHCLKKHRSQALTFCGHGGPSTSMWIYRPFLCFMQVCVGLAASTVKPHQAVNTGLRRPYLVNYEVWPLIASASSMPLVQPTLLRDDAASLPQDNLSEAPPVRHATSAHCLKKHRPQALTFCGHGGPSTSMWIYRPFLCFMQVCVGLAASTVKPHQAVNTGLRRPYLVNYEVWPLIASASSMPLVQPTLLRDDAASLPQDNLSEAPPVRHATSAHCLKKHRSQALTFCGHGGPSTSMWIYRPFLCFMQVCVGLAASTVKPHQAVNTGLRRPYLVNYEVWPLIASASSMPLVQPTLLRDDAPSLPQDNLSEAPPVRHATSAHCLKKHRPQALTFCGHGGPSTSMWIYRPFLCFMQVCVGLAASTVKPHQAVNTGLRRPYLVNYEVWPLIASASSMPLVQPTLLRDDAPSLPQDNLSEAPPVRHATSAHCLKKHRPQALTFCGHGGPSTSMWIYRPFLCFMQVCVGLAASTVKPHQAVNTGLRRPYLVNYEVWPLIASASSMPLVQPTLLRDDAASLPQDNLSEAPPVRHATSAHCLKKHRPQALTFCGHGGPSTSMWIYRPFLCFMQVCVGLAASTVKPHQAVNTGLRRPYLVNYEVWPLIASASSMPLVQPTLLRDDAASLPQDNLSEAPPVRHATSAHCLKKHRPQALTFCGHGGPSTSMWIYRPFLCFMQVCVGLAASTVKPHQAVNTGLRRPYLVNYEVWPLIASASSMPLVQPTLLRDDAPSLPQDNLSEAPPVRHATSAHCLKKHRSQALTFCGHGGPSTSMWIYRPFLCFMQVCVGLAASTVKPHQAVNTGLRRPYLVNYEVWPPDRICFIDAAGAALPCFVTTPLRYRRTIFLRRHLFVTRRRRTASKSIDPRPSLFVGTADHQQACGFIGLSSASCRPYLVNYEVWPLIASASSMPLVQPTLLRDDAASLPQDNLSEAPPVRHATSAHCLKKHRPQALTFCGHGGPSTSMWIYRPFLCFMQVCVGLAASTVKPHQAVNTGLRRPYLVNYEVWPLIASAASMPLVQPTLLRDDAPSLPQDNLSEAPPVRHATSAHCLKKHRSPGPHFLWARRTINKHVDL